MPPSSESESESEWESMSYRSPKEGGKRVGHRILQSPTSQSQRVNPLQLLGSNDDQLERARSRAARAAASRRKSLAASARPPHLDEDDFYSSSTTTPDLFAREQVLQLLQNCIKLASENKINQRNTWDLGLIDHLSEIIRADAHHHHSETNFQKASCTLEAGVKIYSLRVDSTHSEAYKVLGGINRVGREEGEAEGENDKENLPGNIQSNDREGEGIPKKEQARKLSPLSTLESSFDALNVKKFDVAFTIDPLYHQTSAQFDEGGAKGLLLSNLGVYGADCKVLFDSRETPGKNVVCETALDKAEFIDISFAKDQFEQMLNSAPTKREISPTLKEIINQFNEENQRPPNVFSEPMQSAEQDGIVDTNEAGYEADLAEPWNGGNDDGASIIDDELSCVHPGFVGHQEENDYNAFPEYPADDRVEKIAGFLSLGLGLSCKANAWAGPDHWKYQRARGLQQNPDPSSESKTDMPKKSKRQDTCDLEFSKSVDLQMPDIFLPPKNPKTLLLPANRAPCNITLPEDCHYQPESLIKLFLLPNVMCFGKKRRSSEETRVQNDTYGPMDTWDNESTANDHFDDGSPPDNLDDPGDLVSQPRQIQKLDIKYDKFSKQVDVHALKTALWDQIQKSADKTETGCGSPLSFKQVFECLRNENMASQEGISPHLSLICLLHLANEHCLRICDRPTLDELDVYVPLSLAAEN